MKIMEIFAAGHYGQSDGCGCRDFNYGDDYDYSFESRNRPGGDKADFDDRDTPVPMFRGNRAGPLS